ncbi:MAG: ComF family protein [Pseudomonadales bacterium]
MHPWLRRALYELIPGNCILCESRSYRNLDLCRACEQDLPWLTRQCYGCALPLASSITTCGACTVSPPPWEHCFAAFEYTWPIDHLIGEFKNNGQLLTGKILGSLLACAFAWYHPAAEFPDLLVPVPLHKDRLRQRGYNQATEIADVLATHCRIAINAGLCRKIRETPQQKLLDARTRQRNIKNAYQLDHHVTGVRVGVVDDVVTTGATARELTETLLKAGAASVVVIALARTPAPQQGPADRHPV